MPFVTSFRRSSVYAPEKGDGSREAVGVSVLELFLEIMLALPFYLHPPAAATAAGWDFC